MIDGTPFLVFGLPRSRTYWLSRLLSYDRWACSHDQAATIRSVDDVKSWLAMPYAGSVETAAAPFWRLARHYRPDLRLAVVRRDRGEVAISLLKSGLYDRVKLGPILARYDRALDSAAKAPGCLSVDFKDLARPEGCAALFEHCLGLPFDHNWWASLAPQNLQIKLQPQINYVRAHAAQIRSAASACAKAQRYVSLHRQVSAEPDEDGITIREEVFADWWRDGQRLIAAHCAAIGEPSDMVLHLNTPLFERLARAGMAQIITARLNGRMMGYLTALFAPSLESAGVLNCTQCAFFVSPDARNLQLAKRLQKAAIDRARQKGASKMYFRAGVRGEGPRLGALYSRIGARDFGQLYELDL